MELYKIAINGEVNNAGIQPIKILWKRYALQRLKDRFKELGYEWLPFMFIGIRSKETQANKFDDTFIFIDGDKIAHYPNTTNAGTTYLQKLLNPKGTAMLVPNQYKNTHGR